jgi:sugar lactone lactonase YvrE
MYDSRLTCGCHLLLVTYHLSPSQEPTMPRTARLLFALLALITMVAVLPPSPLRPASVQAEQAPLGPGKLIGLPGSCVRGLPSGVNEPACCLLGFVVIDGEIVEGAKVTVTLPDRSVREDWTGMGSAYTDTPYYAVGLNLAVGDRVTITAEYSGFKRTIEHILLAGRQRVDVILKAESTLSYVLDQTIAEKNIPETFSLLEGVAVGPDGTVYVVDLFSHQVQVFDENGNWLRSWGALGDQPGSFHYPREIAVDENGTVYVADNNGVFLFSNNGKFLRRLATNRGDISLNGISGIGFTSDSDVYLVGGSRLLRFSSTGRFLSFWYPASRDDVRFDDIAVSDTGDIYLTASDKALIYHYSPAGNLIKTIEDPDNDSIYPSISVSDSGEVFATNSFDNAVHHFSSEGILLNSWSGFNYPNGIAISSEGELIISDRDNYKIKRYSQTGTMKTSWGQPTNFAEQFSYPYGVAIAPNGDIYIADTYNHRIQHFTSSGSFVGNWGSIGTGDGQFYLPFDLSIGSDGSVYVADTGVHRIQQFSSTGTFIREWGQFGSNNGQFKSPRGIDVAANGDVLVSDSGNNRIQRFSSEGGHLASFGSEGQSDGQFQSPMDVAVSSMGDIFVADHKNNRVQRFSESWELKNSWQANFVTTIDVSLTGKVYAGDPGQTITVFTSEGEFISKLGFDGSGKGGFKGTSGIGIDSKEQIYILDQFFERLQIFRPIITTRPHGNIIDVDPPGVVQGQPITFHGAGSDSDATPNIAAYEWFIEGSDQPFATTAKASLDTSALAPGTYMVSFRVRDEEGEYSEAERTQIEVYNRTLQNDWTFILYLAGDTTDNLHRYFSKNEAEGAINRLLSSVNKHQAKVSVVALVDAPGYGNTLRYVYRSDSQGNLVKIEEGAFQGETEWDMSDPATLSEHISGAKTSAPAKHYYLAIANHASALHGIAQDTTTGSNAFLTREEIRQVLNGANRGGTRPIDIVHFDACQMGAMEVAYMVGKNARYVIASQHRAFSAFAYDTYRSAIKPSDKPVDVVQHIVNGYADHVAIHNLPYTISAIDTSQIDAVIPSLDAFSTALKSYAFRHKDNRTALLDLRQQVQTFDTNGDLAATADDDFIDLRHWSELAQANLNDADITTAATTLQQTLDQFVVAEKHASGKDTSESPDGPEVNLSNSHGMSIFFPRRPSDKLYQTYLRGETFLLADQLPNLAVARAAQLNATDATTETLLVDSTRELQYSSNWDEFLTALLDSQPYDDTVQAVPTLLRPGFLPALPPQLDLLAPTGAIAAVPEPLRVGVPSELSVTVQQTGKAALGNVAVQLYLGDPAAGGTPLPATSVAVIEPEASATTVPITWTPTISGEVTLYAVLDPENAIAEQDETNNVISTTVTILSPDLLPIDDGLSLSPHPARIGEPATLSLTLQLLGGTASLQGLPVDFYQGDPANGGSLIERAAIPEIASGETVTTPAIAWTPSITGVVQLCALIDPEQSVIESDKANNTLCGLFTVLPQPPAPVERVTANLQVLYDFRTGSGNTIADRSGNGPPLDLTIIKPAATRWLPNGLEIHGFTTISSLSPASKVIAASRASNEITLEAWLTPAEVEQFSARVISLSDHPARRNISLIQGFASQQAQSIAVGRLRTSTTAADGGTPLVTADGSLPAALSHLVLTRSANGVMRIFINGVEQASLSQTGSFANWNTTYPLLLAGESNGRRWRGTFHLVAIYSRALQAAEVEQNFLAGPNSP